MVVWEYPDVSDMEPSNYKMSKSDTNPSHGALSSVVELKKSCVACTGTNTTLWRNGPDGPKVSELAS